MYVFVTVSELKDPERLQQLGQVADDIPLRGVLDLCFARISQHIAEQDRGDARHFWFNDKFVPFRERFLRDLSSSGNVALELRPDHYWVWLPGHERQRYAIDPELTVARVIDDLLERPGASCCYDLRRRGERPLDSKRSLWDQQVVPYHARLSQQETELEVRRKPGIWLAGLIALAACAIVGAGLGYMLAALRV